MKSHRGNISFQPLQCRRTLAPPTERWTSIHYMTWITSASLVRDLLTFASCKGTAPPYPQSLWALCVHIRACQPRWKLCPLGRSSSSSCDPEWDIKKKKGEGKKTPKTLKLWMRKKKNQRRSITEKLCVFLYCRCRSLPHSWCVWRLYSNCKVLIRFLCVNVSFLFGKVLKVFSTL